MFEKKHLGAASGDLNRPRGRNRDLFIVKSSISQKKDGLTINDLLKNSNF